MKKPIFFHPYFEGIVLNVTGKWNVGKTCKGRVYSYLFIYVECCSQTVTSCICRLPILACANLDVANIKTIHCIPHHERHTWNEFHQVRKSY